MEFLLDYTNLNLRQHEIIYFVNTLAASISNNLCAVFGRCAPLSGSWNI